MTQHHCHHSLKRSGKVPIKPLFSLEELDDIRKARMRYKSSRGRLKEKSRSLKPPEPTTMTSSLQGEDPDIMDVSTLLGLQPLHGSDTNLKRTS